MFWSGKINVLAYLNMSSGRRYLLASGALVRGHGPWEGVAGTGRKEGSARAKKRNLCRALLAESLRRFSHCGIPPNGCGVDSFAVRKIRPVLNRFSGVFLSQGYVTQGRYMTALLAEPIRCPVCRSGESRDAAGQPDDYEYNVGVAVCFRIRLCDDCASEFVWPRPSLEQLRQMYPDTYYAYDQEMGRFWRVLYDRRCMAEAKRLLQLSSRRPLRLFDVGAGDCRHFRAIGTAGDFEFSGVEMNQKMVAQGCRSGFDISCGTFEEFDTTARAGSVDIVTMNHVIEHVIDPHETLSKVHSLLTQDGVFYGRTPKLGSIGHKIFGRYWGGYHFPRHLHLFNEKSLQRLLLESGFREVDIIEDLNLFPALSLQNYLLGKLMLRFPLKGGHTKIWPVLVALTAPFSFLDYFLGRGDCMIFVARK